MSTGAERVAADLLRRYLGSARLHARAQAASTPEVVDAITRILDQIDSALPEATSNSMLLRMAPGPETINAAWLRETAKDICEPVFCRNVTPGTARNLKRRMAEPNHPWYGCTLQTEPAEEHPELVALYLDAPS